MKHHGYSMVLNWLWVMGNNTVAYFMIHKNRSKVAFLELIQDWEGILVSDNYGVYAKWINLRQTYYWALTQPAVLPAVFYFGVHY